jgi:hypothetical protein
VVEGDRGIKEMGLDLGLVEKLLEIIHRDITPSYFTVGSDEYIQEEEIVKR